MIKTKITVGHSNIADFLQKYQNVEHFLAYCKQCQNYNSKWSCPPLAVNPRTYLDDYSEIYLIGLQMFYDEETKRQVNTKEKIVDFSAKLLRKMKNKFFMSQSLPPGFSASSIKLPLFSTDLTSDSRYRSFLFLLLSVFFSRLY